MSSLDVSLTGQLEHSSNVTGDGAGHWFGKREGSGCVSLVPMVALGPTSAQGKPVDLNNP
jgi:hypothetical protein